MPTDADYMRLALRLARRGLGTTSPNPMVGAILVRGGKIIGRGWHQRAGGPHAEIEALHDCEKRGHRAQSATLFVTLEPCSTYGRTPPCTNAIIDAQIRRVVVGATDPNPRHAGMGFEILKDAGIKVSSGVLENDCIEVNEAFNHWIVRRTPLVTVKAAMSLDGKLATVSGKSKWITSAEARAYGMQLRQGADAILVGINTILADDPSLTWRRQDAGAARKRTEPGRNSSRIHQHRLRRIILDANARTPSDARVVSDKEAALTTIVVSDLAPKARLRELAKRANILVAPLDKSKRGAFVVQSSKFKVQGSRFSPGPPPPTLNLRWLLRRLGSEEVTSLLVEGGGAVNASFLLEGLAQRIAFFYAPKILGGREARKAVAGTGICDVSNGIKLSMVNWRRLGEDWLLSAHLV